jgi:uncharacterized cupredoxin-like copper-binding protein
MPRARAVQLAALLAVVALVAAACSLPDPALGGRGEPTAAASPSPARPHRPGPTWATGAPVRVVMNDRFRYRPSSIMVRAGQRVTFEVTNTGKLSHEFILGDRAAQLDHEREMRADLAGGGMDAGMEMDMGMHAHMHMGADDSGGLTVPPGQTRRLTRIFAKPGMILYGCHVLGHWAAGMRGTIVVLAPDRPLPVAAPGSGRPLTSSYFS